MINHRVQLTKSGTVFSGTSEDLRSMATQFRMRHCVHLGQLIEPTLLESICQRLEQASFQLRVYENFGNDLCPDDTRTKALLNFLCNNRELFQIIQAITGCGYLGSFVGKVYRMVPQQGHTDSWHDDLIDDRKVALSINLSPKPYDGGVLEIRDPSSGRILSQTSNTGFGDGIIFRIADGLEHRRTEVKGDVPKTAFAGWFKSKPEFLEVITKGRKLAARS